MPGVSPCELRACGELLKLLHAPESTVTSESVQRNRTHAVVACRSTLARAARRGPQHLDRKLQGVCLRYYCGSNYLKRRRVLGGSANIYNKDKYQKVN